jgi:hypothetical protein
MSLLSGIRPWLILASSWVAAQAATELESGSLIADGTNLLSVATMAAPSVVDWNNDGKKDLLVGQFDQGKIWIFLNQGTDADPVFDGGAPVLSNGQPITTSYG